MCHSPLKRFQEGWIHLLQHRNHLAAETVAFVGGGCVGAVFAPAEPAIIHPLADFRTGNAQQGTHYPVPVSHPAEPPGAGAADEIEEEGLGVVICIVRHGHAVETLGIQQLHEPGVAQFACRHLYADAGTGGKAGGVEAFDKKREILALTPLSHESLIAVGFIATQAEIAVGYSERGPRKKFGSPFGHIHRIDAAAHCKQHLHYFLELMV